MRNDKGIFCLEGDWHDDLRKRATIEPVLDLLSNSNEPHIPSIRRHVSTEDGLTYYLEKWTQKRYREYPILYLAFHGGPGSIKLSSKTSIDLDKLEDLLAGKCKRRVIHFGSCSTLMKHGIRLNGFLRKTEALAVCGYDCDVDMTLAAAFEIILLSGFQFNALNRAGMRAVHKRVRREARGLVGHLGFKMIVASKT